MHQLPIAIESKDFIGLLLLFVGTLVTTGILLFAPKFRPAAFFLMVGGAAITGMFDLNIYSAYWYRGTSRGFEVTLLDILALGLLFSSMISPRPGQPRFYWPASLGPMILFLVYCLGTTLLATPSIFGLYEISKLVRGIVFFMAAALFVRSERDLGFMVVALALAVCGEGLIAARERLLIGIYRPGGTFFHPNSLSMYLCLVTPVLVAAGSSTLHPWIRRLCWLAVVVAGGTMVLTLSRAGLPIFVVVAGAAFLWCASWRPTPGSVVVGALATIFVGAVVLQSLPLIKERFGQATLQEEYFDGTGETRGYYFRQAEVILDEKPLFGVGLNNWSYWVSREYGKAVGMRYENYDDIVYAPPTDVLPMFRFAAPAHNLGVLTAAEIGWIGLALLLVLWARWLMIGAGFLFSRRPEALHRIGIGVCFGVLGVFLHSFTEWTFRQTQIFLAFHLLAGAMASLHALKKVERQAALENAGEPDPEWDPASGLSMPIVSNHN
jgi:hypothetical protein